MGQGRGRERERNALRYSSGRSYPPRNGREFDRERRAARKKRRRRRLIKALAAWAACILAVAAVAFGAVRFVGYLGTSKQRSLREQGMEAMEQKEYQEAIRVFDEALAASDEDRSDLAMDILCRRGEAEYALGDYEAAAHTYNLLMERDSYCPEYWYMASICNSRMGKGDQTLLLYRQAQQKILDGQDLKEKEGQAGRLKALAALGPSCRELGLDEEALSLYEEAIGEGLDHEEIYNQMGLCQMAGADYENAADSFDQGKVKARESENQELLKELSYNRAVCSEYLGQYEEALRLFQDYKEQFGENEAVQHEITFLESRVD